MWKDDSNVPISCYAAILGWSRAPPEGRAGGWRQRWGVAASCGNCSRIAWGCLQADVAGLWALHSKDNGGVLPLLFFFCLFVFLPFSEAASAAHGDSQVRGRIAAVATGLHQSCSNAGSELRLQPTPQLRATPDPQPTEQGQGSNPQSHGS